MAAAPAAALIGPVAPNCARAPLAACCATAITPACEAGKAAPTPCGSTAPTTAMPRSSATSSSRSSSRSGGPDKLRLMTLAWLRMAKLSALATRCNSFTLAKALNFAILNHAKVINLSLSGPPDRLLERLLDVALERGIAVVGAVDPHASSAAFPASHAGVIAVAQQAASGAAKVSGATGAGNATTINAVAGHAASNGASAPDTAGAIGAVPAGTVYAPGRDIPTTAPGARWSFVSGSSFAAAHVSGMLALLDQLQPASTPAQLHRRLLPIDGLNAGNIDACATITRVTGACSCSCVNAVNLKVGSRP